MHRNPETVHDALSTVQALLDGRQPAAAMAFIRGLGSGSPELRNAYGVALLRAGEPDKAVDVYRDICLNKGSVCLNADVPTVYKANYATALLLTGNAVGCLSLLKDLDQAHPSVQRLRAAIEKWRRSLGWWRRFRFAWSGATSGQIVPLDFPPGEPVATREMRPAA